MLVGSSISLRNIRLSLQSCLSIAVAITSVSVIQQIIEVFEITNRRCLTGLVRSVVANDDFQQNNCSWSLQFSLIYHKTAGRNFLEPNEFHAVPMSDLPDDF
ncbi:hypothetical protein TNCV_4653071 [Trichonephila clavipes]|nr:hypothetical protein TNCV_4653071 [Trichonephila clavipes]